MGIYHAHTPAAHARPTTSSDSVTLNRDRAILASTIEKCSVVSGSMSKLLKDLEALDASENVLSRVSKASKLAELPQAATALILSLH